MNNSNKNNNNKLDSIMIKNKPSKAILTKADFDILFKNNKIFGYDPNSTLELCDPYFSIPIDWNLKEDDPQI